MIRNKLFNNKGELVMKLKDFLDNNNLELYIVSSTRRSLSCIKRNNSEVAIIASFTRDDQTVEYILNFTKERIEDWNSLIFEDKDSDWEEVGSIDIENINNIKMTDNFLLQKQLEYLNQLK